MDINTINLIKILVVGIVFGSLFIIKSKKIKYIVAGILTAYLIMLGARVI